MNPQCYEEAPACYHGYLDRLTSDDALSELQRSGLGIAQGGNFSTTV